MRIGHIVEPFSSGIITFIIHLTDALSHHEHVVIHGTRTTNDTLEAVRSRFHSGVTFMIWPYADRSIHPVRDLQATVALYRILKEESFDVIHLHSAKAGFIGRVVTRLLGFKHVIYTPNSAPFLRTDVSSFQRWIFRNLEYFSGKLGGKLICCGPSELKEYLAIGLPAVFINNGIPVQEILPLRRPEHSLKLVTSGIITYQKNPEEFNAIADYFAGDSGVTFTWIGDGILRPLINEKLVRITGWKQKEDSQEELRAADIYVSTALWEGQPFAVLEAMNYGKCLILRDCPGNRDLVRQGINGYLFSDTRECIEKIELLLENPQRVAEMGQQSRRICEENHDIKNTAQAYEQEYRKLVDPSTGTGH